MEKSLLKSVHFLWAIGKIRHVWYLLQKKDHGIATSLIDLGDRFRLIINDVEVKKAEKPMPKLPVATAFWTPEPSLDTGAAAWIYAGGAHHTAFSYDLTAEQMGDWAAAMGTKQFTLTKTPRSETSREICRWEAFSTDKYHDYRGAKHGTNRVIIINKVKITEDRAKICPRYYGLKEKRKMGIREDILNAKTALGIEFGSTRIKAVLVDSTNAPIASGSHEWENRLDNGIWTYTLEVSGGDCRMPTQTWQQM